jgi:hypothetical protein
VPASALVVGWVLGAVICAVIAAAIGPRNGWSAIGAFFMGLLLGLIGVLIVAFARGGNTPTDRDQQWEEWNRWEQWQQFQAWQAQQLPGNQGQTSPPPWLTQPRPVPPGVHRLRIVEAPNIGDDFATLPSVLRTTPLLALPAGLLLVGVILYVLLPNAAPAVADLIGYYVQFFFAPPALATFFIAGLLAPRSGYLVGLVYGVLAATVWSAAVLTDTMSQIAFEPFSVVVNFLVIGLIYGGIVTTLGRFVRRLVEVTARRR